MEVMKIYSEVDTDEKLYSVLMDEDEFMMFQREFAFRDYEGLSQKQAKALKAKRSEYAKELWNIHKDSQKGISDVVRSDTTSLRSHGTINGGGVVSKYEVTTRNPGRALNAEDVAGHRKRLIDEQLKASGKAKEIMRADVEKTVSAGGAKWKRPTPKKTVGKGFMNQAKGFVGRNKKVLGVTAGLTAAATAGGAYLYNKNKEKSNGNN